MLHRSCFVALVQLCKGGVTPWLLVLPLAASLVSWISLRNANGYWGISITERKHDVVHEIVGSDVSSFSASPVHKVVTCNPAVIGNNARVGHHVGPISIPGTPVIQKWELAPLYRNNTIEDWRQEISERIFKAVDASHAMAACAGFVSYGDYTWCVQALPLQTEFAKSGDYYGNIMHLRNGCQLASPPAGHHFVGLSFGIYLSDPWSELMSNLYAVPTKLHDCFYNGELGPLGHNMHCIKNYSVHVGLRASGTKGRPCYDTAYEAQRVCLGDNDEKKIINRHPVKEIKSVDFMSLKTALKGRGPLSTFVKMDIEGSEWNVLFQLVDDEEEMAKIRSLDMEVHLIYGGIRNGWGDVDLMKKKVRVLERLGSERFAVTGSSIESLHTNLKNEFVKRRKMNSSYTTKEPLVHLRNGFSLDMWCISFVNRQLL